MHIPTINGGDGRMKIRMMLAAFFLLLLSGCSIEDPVEADQTIAAVQVQFINPDEFKKKEIPLEVEVTQDKKPVEDASFVRFEIWRDGERKDSRMIDAKHIGEGHYTAQATVKKKGVYYVYAHTEAHGLHIMPKQKIEVQ